MRAAEFLKKRFDERLSRSGTIATAIEINHAGLVFGAGTVLARMTRDAYGAPRLDVNADWQRVFALLAVAYGRTVPHDVFRHMEAASEQWRRGDKALANIRLAFARLPRLESHADAYRLFHAEELLERGVSPRAVMLAFGFEPEVADLAKYDPNQPRIPAGSGRQSGEWGSGGSAPTSTGAAHTGSASVTITPLPTEGKGSEALVGAAGARAGVDAILGEIALAAREALGAFALRFTIPTAVLGALIIPSPDEGISAQGTLPEHPDVSYRLDRPQGTLVLSTKAADGSDITIHAQNRDGIFVDVLTGTRIGRDLQGDLFLGWGAIEDAIQAREDNDPQARADAQSAPKSDEPQLCPAPVKDTPHGAKDSALDYEDDVHARVNPLAPIPHGFAVMLRDPLNGQPVYFDDCFRYTGDLVDGDMQKGDFADAKGEGYAKALRSSFQQEYGVMADLIDRAQKQTRTAASVGARVKWYFAEEEAADFVRRRFLDERFVDQITIRVMRPRKRHRR